MDLSELYKCKYTILFVLFLVIIVSIWFSRTYRDGRFSQWIAPTQSYGTGIIEGMSDASAKKCDRRDKSYCVFKDYKIGESVTSPINVATGDASKFPTAKVGGSQSAAPVQRAIQGQGTVSAVAGPAGASDSIIPKRYYYTTNNYVLKDEAAAVAKNALKGSIPGNVPGVSAFESPVNI